MSRFEEVSSSLMSSKTSRQNRENDLLMTCLQFNEGVREAFAIKKDAKAEEDQQPPEVPPLTPALAGPSQTSELAPQHPASGFRKIFFPWTTYDFSMPEGDAVAQSTLIQIFSQNETAVSFLLLLLLFLLPHFSFFFISCPPSSLGWGLASFRRKYQGKEKEEAPILSGSAGGLEERDL